MKTVTLWNVPVDVAQMTVKALQEKAAEKVLAGDLDEAQKLIYSIDVIKEEIARVEAKSTEND